MKSNAVITLGNGINSDGSLTADAIETVKLAKNKAKAKDWIIMSGSISYKATFVPPISEAQAMKDYAAGLGLATGRILTEVESRDTFGNAYFTKVNLLIPLGIKSALVIAGPNHSRDRLEYIFNKVFADDISYQLILQQAVRSAEQVREKEALESLKALFDDVPAGDDALIYRRMRSQHPAYRS